MRIEIDDTITHISYTNNLLQLCIGQDDRELPVVYLDIHLSNQEAQEIREELS